MTVKNYLFIKPELFIALLLILLLSAYILNPPPSYAKNDSPQNRKGTPPLSSMKNSDSPAELNTIAAKTILMARNAEADCSDPSAFSIDEGLSKNRFIHNKTISVHALVSDYPMARILTCFPDENSGIALIFDENDPDTQGLKLDFNYNLHPFDEDSKRGVLFGVLSNKKRLVISGIHLGSIRFIRALKYPDGIEMYLQKKEKFLRNAGLPEEGYLYPDFKTSVKGKTGEMSFHRRTLDGKNNFYCSLFYITDNVDAKYKNGKITLTSRTGAPAEFWVLSAMDYKGMEPYEAGEILNSQLQEYAENLEKTNPPAYDKFMVKLKSLAFLSYREKFLAGSWRFLTYFGRDTMMSLMMLRDAVETGVYESGMQSVLDRLSDKGIVAHEEDIGCQAIFDNINDYNIWKMKGIGEADRTELEQEDLAKPVYDYKMVDDDFMLPLMAGFYVRDKQVTSFCKKAFFEKQNKRNEKNIESLLRNMDYITGKTIQYSNSRNFPDLVSIGTDYVGDWRDSNAGLGWGRYPGSINVDFVADSLAAVKDIMGSGIYSDEELMETARKNKLWNIVKLIKCPYLMDKYIAAWKGAKDRFRVRLTAEEVRSKVRDYLENAPLEEGEREYILSTVVVNNVTIKDFLYNNRVPDVLKDGVEFYALSLDKDGKPVEVMNSDSGFRLFFGDPSPEEIGKILQTIDLPYPLGLAEKGGIMVANPAYASNKTLWKTLDRNAYHGRVVWSWQMSLVERGLCRQIRRFAGDEKHKELTYRLLHSLKNLRKMEECAGDLANSELWTHEVVNGKMVPVAYGAKKGSETESNPVQLWSTVGISTMYDYETIMKEIR